MPVGWKNSRREKEKRAQVMAAQEQLKEKEKKLCARAVELERKIPESAAKIKKLAEEILSLQRLEDTFRKSDLVEANQREWKERKQNWNWQRKHFGDWCRQKNGRFLRQMDESGRLRHRLWNGSWDGRDMLPIIKKRFRSKNRFRNVWRKSWMVPSQHLKRKIKM